jgi:hypothetical protein
VPVKLRSTRHFTAVDGGLRMMLTALPTERELSSAIMPLLEHHDRKA